MYAYNIQYNTVIAQPLELKHCKVVISGSGFRQKVRLLYLCLQPMYIPPQTISTIVTWRDPQRVYKHYNCTIRDVQCMSQVTCRFPQACRVGNLRMAARQVVIFHAYSADRSRGIHGKKKIRAEVGTIYTLVTCSR